MLSAARPSEADEDAAGLVPGLKAYDADGNLIGTIESIDRTKGTIRIATNPFFEQPLLVDVRLIAAANGRELYLACTRKELVP